MAEDTGNEGANEDEEGEGDDFGALTGSGDSGLGNLPPLSDFDSADSSPSGNLPALGDLDSDPPLTTPEHDTPMQSDTPAADFGLDAPVSDLDTPTVGTTPIDTPEIIETPSFDSPATGLDTPAPGLDTPDSSDGFGFQDLAADSDFSPETPEIGPGPDSDIDTPLFDSAFGGESGETPAVDAGTPAEPTQAMDTPVFDSGGEVGFDQDAFGASPSPGLGADDMGTPVPDFSPDTEMPPQTPVPSAGGPKAQKTRGVAGVLIAAAMLIVGLLAGIGSGGFVAQFLTFIPNPALSSATEEMQTTIDALNANIRGLQGRRDEGERDASPEELARLIAEIEEKTTNRNELTDILAELDSRVQSSETQLALVMEDINEKNDEFVRNQELLEELKNDSAITRARHEGLLAENTRLTEMVGTLEQANARRLGTRDTLLHNLDLLIIQIEGGIPLTPERYSRDSRLVKAETLRARAARASWVDPALMNDYTDLYISEMDIAASREYFFAKIPVHDILNSKVMKWAECLMNGNWSVYYRTIDGAHLGSYENVAGQNPPRYEFREDLPESVRGEINDQITAARVSDYEEKIAVLNQKQAIFGDKTNLQEVFDSL